MSRPALCPSQMIEGSFDCSKRARVKLKGASQLQASMRPAGTQDHHTLYTSLTSPTLLIVQVGTPPADIRDQLGDLPSWFAAALGLSPNDMKVVRAFEGELLPSPCKGRVAIITGSWAMVTDRAPWSEYVAQWIREAMRIEMPLFGVCYGHQLIAHALGGVVDYHPAGREVGCEMIQLLPRPWPMSC